MSKLEIKIFDSLRKVYLDGENAYPEISSGEALGGDFYNFQIMLRLADAVEGERLRAYPTVKSETVKNVTLLRVGNVPSEMPGYPQNDGDYERIEPGLFPDPLFELDKNGIYGREGLCYALWVRIPTASLSAGEHKVDFSFENDKHEFLGETSFTLKVLPVKKPKAKLIYTQWFHPDCLSTYYNVPAFSEKHWEIIENFIKTAAENGVNMLLTPLFTLPLDTVVGGERPTTQLVDVKKDGKKYSFGFEKLDRWIDLAKKHGIKYFEFSHFFTQWGAKATPKVVATVNGKEKRIFGWDTPAAGKKYDEFLSAFIPELEKFIEEKGIGSRVFFHVSDEPTDEHIEFYAAARGVLKKYLSPKYPVIDALSDHDFYKKGLVDTPVPGTDRYEPFGDDETIKKRWAYYCCTQNKLVSNRFFSMSSARNRILGMQIYKYGLTGFLHWGYNFWYTQYSLSDIDPYSTTDAGGVFPSGDAFSVYPGKDGKAVPSLRLFVFTEALSDLAALQLLEKKTGREKTLELLEKGLEKPLTFKEYPRSAEWLLNKRAEINAEICRLTDFGGRE